MENAKFERSQQALVQRRPFKSFCTELASGSLFTVDHAQALTHRGAVAVYIDAKGYYTLFDSTFVTQVTEPNGNGSQRQRKPS